MMSIIWLQMVYCHQTDHKRLNFYKKVHYIQNHKHLFSGFILKVPQILFTHPERVKAIKAAESIH